MAIGLATPVSNNIGEYLLSLFVADDKNCSNHAVVHFRPVVTKIICICSVESWVVNSLTQILTIKLLFKRCGTDTNCMLLTYLKSNFCTLDQPGHFLQLKELHLTATVLTALLCIGMMVVSGK